MQHPIAATLESRYQRGKVLGKGSFGQAILVKRRSDGRKLVAKEILLANLSAKEREEAKNEVAVLAQMQHPNIVRMYESLLSQNKLYIIMEFADGGDLEARIKGARGTGGFSEDQIMTWFIQICLALKHLHDKKILHRDLKSQNLFLTASGVVKLGDFGISTVLRNTLAQANTVCGTPYYFSPEICRNKPYNNKSDIWALGCVLYEVITLQHAFNGRNMFDLMKTICAGRYTPLTPSKNSSNYTLLLSKMLHLNPAMRLSIDNILRVSFIQEHLRKVTDGMKGEEPRPRRRSLDGPAGIRNEGRPKPVVRDSALPIVAPPGGAAQGGPGGRLQAGGPSPYAQWQQQQQRDRETRDRERAVQAQKEKAEREKQQQERQRQIADRQRQWHDQRAQQERDRQAVHERLAARPSSDRELGEGGRFLADKEKDVAKKELEAWRAREKAKEKARDEERLKDGVTGAEERVKEARQAEDDKRVEDLRNAQRDVYWERRREAEKNKQKWQHQNAPPPFWTDGDTNQPAELQGDKREQRRERQEMERQRAEEELLLRQKEDFLEMRRQAEANKRRLIEGDEPPADVLPRAVLDSPPPEGRRPSPPSASPPMGHLPGIPAPAKRGQAVNEQELIDMLNDALYGPDVPAEKTNQAPLVAAPEPTIDDDPVVQEELHREAQEDFATMKGLIDTILREGGDLLGDETFGDDEPLL